MSGCQRTCVALSVHVWRSAYVWRPAYMSGAQRTCVVLSVHVRRSAYMSGAECTWVAPSVHVWHLAYMCGAQRTWVALSVHVWHSAYMSGTQRTCICVVPSVHEVTFKMFPLLEVVQACHSLLFPTVMTVFLSRYIVVKRNNNCEKRGGERVSFSSPQFSIRSEISKKNVFVLWVIG